MSATSECSKQYPISIMLTSRDMKRSVRFYRDVLGFELTESWPEGDNPMWANLVLDRQSVMLGAHMDPDQASKMCGEDPAKAQEMKARSEEFEKNKAGVGFSVYLMVPDVDAYHKQTSQRGLKAPAPVTQFYGLRDFGTQDPDGYRLQFYTPVSLSSCQSCGMPLKDAQPGQMYCQYCTDEKGKLKSYDAVLMGTAGYFEQAQKMPKPQAEKAAREHLSKMPAWAGKQ